MNVKDINREMKKYEGIIERPHHVSETRAPMPAGNRAAQFAPFAALTGYEEEIRKAAEEHIRRAEGETRGKSWGKTEME